MEEWQPKKNIYIERIEKLGATIKGKNNLSPGKECDRMVLTKRILEREFVYLRGCAKQLRIRDE